MLEPGRTFATTSAYRYGFNGKEQDSILGVGIGIDYNYGFRIYDARAGRFLSVDPLTNSFPWYTPYQYAGNKPIWAKDLDGLEENQSTSTGLSFFPFLVPMHATTPGQMMSQQFAYSELAFSNSPAGRFLNGAYNTIAGLAGSVVSVTYIAESGGTGAGLGGIVAFQFSISTAAIGVSQMTNAVFGKSHSFLDNASSLPGLIAYGENSKNAIWIDGVGALFSTLTMSGGGESFMNLSGFAKSGFGVLSAIKDLKNATSISTAISSLDYLITVGGFTLKSLDLQSGQIDQTKFIQKLDYTVSYNVKKGDNLLSIAKRLGTSVDELKKQNNIKGSDHIKTGQKIQFHNSVYGKGKSNGNSSNNSN